MISLTDLKDWLDIDADDATYDTALQSLEARVVALVERQTGRYFGAVGETTEYVAGTGTPNLWLPEPPVAAGTPPAITVSVEEFSTPGADPVEIAPDDSNGFVVRVRGAEGRLVRKAGAVWVRGYEYGVTYSRGYAEGEEPGEIRGLVLDLCSLKWAVHGREAFRSESSGGYSYTRAGSLEVTDDDLALVPGAREALRAWERVFV